MTAPGSPHRRATAALAAIALVVGVACGSDESGSVTRAATAPPGPTGPPPASFDLENPYGAIALDNEGRAALRVLVRGYSRLVRSELRRRRIKRKVFAVAIDPGQESLVSTPAIAVGVPADRKRLHHRSIPGGWESIWNAYEYTYQPRFPRQSHLVGEMLAAWRVVEPKIEAHGKDATRWVLVQVARQINRAELPLNVTDDATVYVFHEEFGDSTILALRAATPPQIYRRLERRGYVGRLDHEEDPDPGVAPPPP